MKTVRKGSAGVLMACALGAVSALGAPPAAAADPCGPGNVCVQNPVVTPNGTTIGISGALQVCANEPPAPPECAPPNALPVNLGQTGVIPGGAGYTLPDAFVYDLTASAAIALTYCVDGACSQFPLPLGAGQTGLTAANLPGESIVPSLITCADGSAGIQIDVTVTTASTSLWVDGLEVPAAGGGSFTKSFPICR